MPGSEAPWPDVETLIPHRPPMLLVERIVEVSDGGMVCRGRVPAAGPLAAGGVASPLLGLELAAQTAAVLEAFHSRRDDAGEPRIGYLASIREARFRLPQLPAGRPLRATVRSRGAVPPLATYEVGVALEEDGSVLVSGSISTYLVGPLRASTNRLA